LRFDNNNTIEAQKLEKYYLKIAEEQITHGEKENGMESFQK